MKIFLTVSLTLLISSGASAQQRQFYDAAGRNAGRAVTDSQGTTTIYDAAGRRIGSVTQPTQPDRKKAK
jgi:YD repeat-containing protein